MHVICDVFYFVSKSVAVELQDAEIKVLTMVEVVFLGFGGWILWVMNW